MEMGYSLILYVEVLVGWVLDYMIMIFEYRE